eukprot:TRINITY_DN57928_c0_g1_i1.p1 TRINITY_DN57928_c0_g1~~TRINITY_DN57928_c0_g1_i1.p1  ORF type:complete len:310 (+),score=43.07 TRINITY_DN57928_c0_g1_i1:64-993(+)
MHKRRRVSSSRPAPASLAALLAALALLSYSRAVFVAQAAPRTSSKPNAAASIVRPALHRASGIQETASVLHILGGILVLGIASRGVSSKPGLKLGAKVTVGCRVSSSGSLPSSLPAVALVDDSKSSDLLPPSPSTKTPLVLHESLGQKSFALPYVEATLGAPTQSASRDTAAVAAFGSPAASAPMLSACRRAGRARQRASRSGRSYSWKAEGADRRQRRHTGAKLQAVDPACLTLTLSYDASLVRKKIQLGLQSASTHPSAERVRERGNLHASDGLGMAAESCVAGYSFTVQHRLFRSSQLLRSETETV